MRVIRAVACVAAAAISASAISAEAKPRPKKTQWLRMSATAYCVSGTTDSGARTRRGVVAADPRRIPLGSTIRVRGLKGVRDGVFTVLDTGPAVKGREIDIFMPDCAAARAFGRQAVRVRIVARGAAQR
jgi:3D (Asp-Asp-Asp) domain-containing protein